MNTPPVYTDREIFDKVRAHLLAQGKRSEQVNGYRPVCMYRGPDNTKCAVGCLIPDEDYSPEYENKQVGDRKLNGLLEKLGLRSHLRLLDHLQSVHDNEAVAMWPATLDEMAKRFDAEEKYTR
jgi:hypothetical protein